MTVLFRAILSFIFEHHSVREFLYESELTSGEAGRACAWLRDLQVPSVKSCNSIRVLAFDIIGPERGWRRGVRAVCLRFLARSL